MGRSDRAVSPDLLKYLCCFLVIFIHADVPALADTLLLPVARIAVPLFFMISGYYYRQVREKGREGRQIVKVLGLVIAANVLHLGWNVLKLMLRGQSVTAYFQENFGGDEMRSLLLFNCPKYFDSLWYLFAFLYTLLLVCVLRRVLKEKWNRVYILIPILLVANLVLGAYSEPIFGKALPVYISRNFLLCGLPYFLLGDLVRGNKKMKILGKGPLVLLLSALTVAEGFACSKLLNGGVADNYLTTALLAVAVFRFFEGKESFFSESPFLKKIAALGQYSFVIYVLHPIVLEFWTKGHGVMAPIFGEAAWCLKCICPVAVLAVTTVAAVAWGVLKKLCVKKAP